MTDPRTAPRSQKRHIDTHADGRQSSREVACNRARHRAPHRTASSSCFDAVRQRRRSPSQIQTKRSNTLRAHRTLIVSLIARARARRAGERGCQATDHRRLDLRPAARPETGDRLPQGLPEDPRAQSRRRAVGHRHQRRRHRPLRHRRLLARPDQRRRPQRPRVHEDRARRRVRDHQHRQPDLANLSRKRSKGSSRARSATGAKSRAPRSRGPIDLFDRDGASGTQDAFQHIFLGETLKISPSATAETSNGLEQNAVGNRQTGDRLRVVRATPPASTPVGYQGVAVQPAQRQVRPVRRRA